MSNQNKSKNQSGNPGRVFRDIFVISLVAGFSGFFLGLLFAPQTGRNFRKGLLNKINDMIDRSKFAVIEARVKAEEFLEKAGTGKSEQDS